MKVIIIRFGSLGDCILLCPLPRALRDAGASDITIITKAAFAPVFENCDGVDRVLAYDPGQETTRLRTLLRNAPPHDRVVDAHNTMRSRWVARQLGGADGRFSKQYGARLGLIVFKRSAELPTMLQKYQRTAIDAGFAVPTLTPGGLTPPPSAEETAADLLVGVSTQPIAFAPGSRWPSKQWPGFAELVDKLDPQTPIVCLGDNGDRQTCESVAERFANVTNLAGKTDLMTTAAILRRSRCLVSNDSGLMHMAEAVGTPVTAVFGPTTEAFGYYPSLPGSRVVERRLACRPCSRNGAIPCPKRNLECLTRIPADAVAQAVREVGNGQRVYRLD